MPHVRRVLTRAEGIRGARLASHATGHGGAPVLRRGGGLDARASGRMGLSARVEARLPGPAPVGGMGVPAVCGLVVVAARPTGPAAGGEPGRVTRAAQLARP